MMIKNEADIISHIQADEWMMDILTRVRDLELPDWWICAGFIRSKIWDIVHDFSERTALPDVDVIYYDSSNISVEKEKSLEKQLILQDPLIPWSVKNQARMHLVNGVPPYKNSEDAIAKFPETATALGVKVAGNTNVILTAPLGVTDVLNCLVKPTPYFMKSEERLHIYEERVRKKQWHLIWEKVKNDAC